MIVSARTIFKICVFFSVYLLVDDLLPGFFGPLRFPFFLVAFFTFPIVAGIILATVIFVVIRFKKEKENSISALKYLLGSGVVVAVSCMMVYLHISLRAAFYLTENSLTEIVESQEFTPESLQSRQIGLWCIDKCKTDDTGGVYLRIGGEMDGISPDWISYGFAYRPDPELTPFGRAGYELTGLAGEWYFFSVSDDY